MRNYKDLDGWTKRTNIPKHYARLALPPDSC
jgi:hypothetical protein